MAGSLEHHGKQSEAEKEFGEILQLADPDLTEYVARNEALRKRVTVLERALEGFADPLGWPPSLREKPYVVHMRNLAQAALDG